MFAIEALNLRKSFGEVTAVDGISFNVKKGEIFGFLGPNGAGKTTTIRMLIGLLRPDEGEARVMGYDIIRQPAEARKLIGVVPEEANPYPDLSAEENLFLVGMLYDLPRRAIKEKSEELLKLLDIYNARKRKAKRLSKGMRQKLLVAMALMGDPEVLFLDEPTSGLDILSARKIRDIILDLKKRGVTVFLTTHNVEEAGEICDRVAVINNGKIMAMGTPEELKIRSGRYSYVKVVFDRSPDRDISSILNPYDHILMERKLTIICDRPGDAIVRVVRYAMEKNLEIKGIETSGPKLEDVFIEIVGGERS